MKENESRAILQDSLKWQIGSFIFWSLPLVYTGLYLSPLLLLFPPEHITYYLFFRFYILLAILLSIKYLTFTYFPDVSTSKDEFRKLFTSITTFHFYVPASGILYPMLFKELGLVLGYSRITSWGSFYATTVGVAIAVAYLLRHEYINYWYDPPYSRLQWISIKAPEAFVVSVTFNSFIIIAANFFWFLWKYEFPGFDYWLYGVAIYFIDSLLTKILKNFLAKPTKLEFENNLGEELAISGLLLKDPEIHFQCLQDLNRASNNRKLKIMNPKTSQWNLLLETALNYLNKVPRHLQNYSIVKTREKVNLNYSQNIFFDVLSWVYFVFNEPFEVKFRNELFKLFTMSALASKVLTKFVTASGMHSFILKDNSLSAIIQAQVETISEIDKYALIDKNSCLNQFRDSILLNLSDIKAVYSDYLTSISLRGDALQLLYKIG